MKRFSVLAISFAALTVLTPLRANPKCSASTLRGAYGYTVTGTRPAGVPFAAVGKIEFDGKDRANTIRTLSDGGNIIRNDTGAGNYSLDSECRGAFSIGTGPLGQLIIDIVVTDGGNQIRGIVTNPGFVLLFEGRRVANGNGDAYE